MKRDLFFKKPLMNAAGALGFFRDQRVSINWHNLGAFVTNPISLRPRQPAVNPVCIEYTGGFLIHSGLPNPGFEAALRRFSSQWSISDLPVIVHLMADRPEETRRMVQMLEGIENVMGVELSFDPFLADDIVLLSVEMCQSELPLIVSIPGDKMLRIGVNLCKKGVAALSLSDPRGTLAIGGDQGLATGRLLGPSLFPQNLGLIQAGIQMGLSIIGTSGVWSNIQAEAMLQAGALAVQLDRGLWLPKNTDLVL